MSSQVGQDRELEAVGCQFVPYLNTGFVCMLVVPLYCNLRCCS